MSIGDPNYSLLPEHDRGSMRRYLEHGIIPGGFLQAVICNDLKEAFARADEINTARMWDVVNFMYNEVPSPAWGSADRMNKWHMKFQKKEGE